MQVYDCIHEYFCLFLGDFYYASSGLSSSRRPDVVPGNSVEEELLADPGALPLSSLVLDQENSGIDNIIPQGENKTIPSY